MKDEIKENLDYFRKYATLYENIIINKIEDYIITLQEEKEDYKSRSEKAIKMFDNENLNKYYYGMSYEFEINDFKEDMLNILQGSDKNE